MKWMKKLRLINWHYFTDETMEFGKQTLITGQNGAGKSTIIDAMQVIFVADQRNIRFNPAAHDEAKRTMINYLKGKIGSDDRTFVREGDFTSYITAEFRDDKQRESFVIGVVIDVFRDQSYEEEYFIIANQRIEDLEFVKPSGELRNREEFRRLYSSSSASRGSSVFERNKSNYQKALLSRMGTLHERFFSIFIKALSFKPIHNIRDFVYDYILDQKELQLDLMKQNFDIHERYQQELQELLVRKDKLQGIRERYRQFDKHRETVKEQDYVIRRLQYEGQREIGEQLVAQAVQLDEKLTKVTSEVEFAERKKQEANRQALEAYQLWQNNAAEQQKRQLTDELHKQEREQDQLKRQLEVWGSQLRMELSLLQSLEGWQGTAHYPFAEAEQRRVQSSIEALSFLLRLIEQEQPLQEKQSSMETELQQIGSFLSSCSSNLIKASAKLEDEMNDLDQHISELKKVIRDLENRKLTYPPAVQRLQERLQERLAGRSDIRIFCEEMEIEDESWRDAVEGYLNTQRFDLLVDPPVFAEALSVYEQDKYAYKLEGVGLVDTEKEQRYLGTAKPNTLANVLQAEDEVVLAHIEHLLGKVHQAEHEQELRQFRTAITRTCMVYNNLVARQIPKRQYEVPFIGAKAIARQLEIKRQELAEAEAQRKTLQQENEELGHWSKRLQEKQSQYGRLAEHLPLPEQLQQARAILEELRTKLQQLDLSEAERLKAAYEAWSAKEKEWDKEYVQLEKVSTKLETEQKHIEARQTMHSVKIKEAEQHWQQWIEMHDEATQQRALSRWEDAVKQDIPISKKTENWENSLKRSQTLSQQEFVELQKQRQRYNIDYSFNVKVDQPDNQDYDALLHEIEHLNVPEYQQKVDEALKESEEQFKSHFIFKLREAIEMARREFHELNFALKNFPFSEDKYHFEVSASEKYKKFYDAVMDPQLMERGSLFDIPDQDRSEVLHELFELLVRGEAGDMEEFTDYRRYLDFDIIVHTRDSRYRFSQVLKEKSGGETQTPFYIAILASFHHLYHSNKTMRLVVFDEAFNKMDEQRIQTSLRLIKQLSLQLVASVPDEKMQHMSPEVSTTLIVSNHNYECFVDMIDRWEDDELDHVDEHQNPEKENDQANKAELQQENLF